MKTKINRKTLQAKLNHGISAVVKSVVHTDSKKINKSIKKASKVLAKAVTKTMKGRELRNAFAKKSAVQKTRVNKQAKAVAIRRSSFKAIRKIKKVNPAKIAQKAKEGSAVAPEVNTERETLPMQ